MIKQQNTEDMKVSKAVNLSFTLTELVAVSEYLKAKAGRNLANELKTALLDKVRQANNQTKQLN